MIKSIIIALTIQLLELLELIDAEPRNFATNFHYLFTQSAKMSLGTNEPGLVQ